MPSLDKDRVVVLHVRVFGNARACECLIFIFLQCICSYCWDGLKWIFCRYITAIRVERLVLRYERTLYATVYPLELFFFAKFLRT